MSTTLIEGFNTQFGYADTSGGAPTYLGELLDVEPAGAECSKINTTHMKSTGKVKTYQGGLKEPGEAKATVHMDKTEYAAVGALVGVTKYWTVLYADGSKEVQQGFLMNKGVKVDIDGINAVELTVQMTGASTFTPAS